MLIFLQNLKILIRGKLRYKFFRFQFYMITVAILEVTSVSLIAPMVGIATSPDEFLRKGMLLDFRNFFGLGEEIFVVYLTIVVLLVIIFAAIASMLITWRLSLFSEQIGADLTSSLYSFYIRKEWIEHTKNTTANRLIVILKDAPEVVVSLNDFLNLNSKCILVLCFTVGLLLLDPLVTLSVLIIFLLLYLSIFLWAKKLLQSNSVELSRAWGGRIRTFRNSFGALKEIILLNKREFFIQRFTENGKRYAKKRGNNLTMQIIPRYFVELVMFGSIIIFSFFLISTKTSVISILPIFSVFAVAGLKLIPAFQAIYHSIAAIQGRVQHLNNIKDDIKLISEEATNKGIASFQNSDKKVERIGFFKEIELKNIAYRYPEKEKNILDGINLKIKKNSTVGIAGPSGSGKTTLADILMSLIRADSGELLIDGVRIKIDNQLSWQQKIAFVPQTLFLIDGTVKENILLGKNLDLIDETKLDSILELTELSEVLKTLPEGLDTYIGDDGIQLSGGQRQRVGIARALYKNSEIIVLDEATSALDGISEAKIMDSLEKIKGSKTIILIAHRLSTLIEADKIVLLNNGRIEAEGNYENLIKNSELFRKMDKKNLINNR